MREDFKVKTEYGWVQGMVTNTPGISMFKGIPYAKAPIREHRWKGPIAPEAWDKIKQCTSYGPSCWQTDNTNSPYNQKCMELNPVKPTPLVMDEDCLSLNIWTPADTELEKLPVMVWFYGGGLQGGTTDDITFDGEGLCSEGVVLVTVNYRTGVFGYFGHSELERENESHTSGNYGLQDQIFALKWVNKNIINFGGNPENVTIFGCSGGGRSVQGISCSPMSRGLVHHAICQSAGGVNPDYSISYDNIKQFGQEFMEFCRCSSIEEMRKIPAEQLQKKYDQFGKQFNITGDGYILPYPMDEIIRRGEQADIDYILSTMNDEIKRPVFQKVTLENFEEIRKTFSPRNRILSTICQPTTDEEAEVYAVWAEVYEMKAAQLAWAKIQNLQNKKSIYLCTFVHPLPGDDMGAFHGGDQYYVFHTLHRFWRPFTKEDEALSQTMMQYWTNFAKTGNPNGEGMDVWKPYTKEHPLTFIIDVNHCEMQDRAEELIEETANVYIEYRK